MRLYSRTGVTALDDAEYGTFTADTAGGFDFPDDVSDRLYSFHLHGRPMWETEIERQQRLVTEELERRKDPAALLDAVNQILEAAKASQALTALVPPPAPVEPVAVVPTEPAPTEPTPVEPEPVAAEPAKRPSKRAASKPASE